MKKRKSKKFSKHRLGRLAKASNLALRALKEGRPMAKEKFKRFQKLYHQELNKAAREARRE